MKDLLSQCRHAAEAERWADAWALFGAALRLCESDLPEGESTVLLEGISLALRSGNEAAANQLYNRRLIAAPQDGAFFINAGNRYLQHGRPAKAARILRRLLPRHTDTHALWDLLGQAYLASENLPKALDTYIESLAHFETEAAYANILWCFQRLDQPREVRLWIRRALSRFPGSPHPWTALSILHAKRLEFPEARDAAVRATRCTPANQTAWIQRANTEDHCGAFAAAETSFRRVMAMPPVIVPVRMNLVQLLNRQGRYAEASDTLHETPDEAPRWHPTARPWVGDPLSGESLLFWSDQGLGDLLMYLRLAPLALDRGAGSVAVACPDHMLPLLSRFSDPAVAVISFREAEDRGFAVQAPLGRALPYMVRTEADLGAARVPYLSADPALIARWADRLPPPATGQRVRIGLNWHGNTWTKDVVNHGGRSFVLTQAASILHDPRSQCISLQAGEAAGQARGMGDHLVIPDDLDSAGGAFMDSAAIMTGLDLVITCDTSIAHLAGALGVPVWVLLKTRPEWRFGIAGQRMPWYPTMRLFRQDRPGDWRSAFRKVEAALEAHLRDGTPLI